jgi:hypothetical protein
MSRGNLRKNRKNLSIPNVATVNVNDADPVHRLIDERPTIIGVPRHGDDDPIHRLVEALHLNGVTLRIEPAGVSGGVGGGVEENFKMHSLDPFVIVFVMPTV